MLKGEIDQLFGDLAPEFLRVADRGAVQAPVLVHAADVRLAAQFLRRPEDAVFLEDRFDVGGCGCARPWHAKLLPQSIGWRQTQIVPYETSLFPGGGR